ncbi:uncharacterized protein N7518_009135 [Penicillium psychrosexuale]|uniref:uncharacterized protein n=1 Tax=Penicillium psychrosexuale TaxID=1002107 RepID=UPI0025454A30|nr:uncharacterized protein N7518_009135 [Penicillium psychrosexuale]KAJ5783458.1 hypothetical protein N7518_009135 [Penicillium psychrosexuale]
MQLKPIVVCGLLSAASLAAGQTIGSLFKVNLDNDEAGGCSERSTLLAQYLQESKDLATAGLQAITHAQDSSAAQHDVAKRYLRAYFGVGENDATALALIKGSLQKVSNFLSGTTLDNTPRLYCNDNWLKKRARTDIARDIEGNDIWTMDDNGQQHLLAIENCDQYRHLFWDYDEDQMIWIKNERIPYWSADLGQYLVDDDYDGQTFCTVARGANMGTTQHMTTPPTITLCPGSFSEPGYSVKLGSKSPLVGQRGGRKLTDVLPRSATLYHELFHLVLGNDPTPDVTYLWVRQQLLLENPDEIITEAYKDKYDEIEILPTSIYGMTRADAIRHNPESYVFFSVGYWYFMQTTWSNGDNSQRWSFHSGVSQMVQIP